MKKLLLFMVTMLMPMMASAYDFELDGFFYNVISVSDLTLELTTDVENLDVLNGGNNKKYSGDIIIPSKINYKGKEWSIIKICGTFNYCSDVTSVNLPSTITEIGPGTFVGCTSMKEITLPNSLVKIGEWSFGRCGIEKMTFPPSIEYFDRCPFFYFDSLKEVVIEDGDTSVFFEGGNYIEKGVFSDCPNLESAYIGRNYTSHREYNVYSQPFKDSKKLKSVKFGDKITSVPPYSFYGCNSLEHIDLPNSVCSIGANAFEGCASLEILDIPSSVTTIADNVFKNCSSLKASMIRNGMTSIGKSAYEGCTSLSSIDIVKSINNIGANAFNGCINLKEIYVHSAYPISNIEESSFNGSSYLDAVLYVPTGCTETYYNAPVWKLFFNIQEKKYGFNLTYIVDGEEYRKYEIEEGEIIVPESTPSKEGYTFSGWSEIPEMMPAHDVTITGTFSINSYKLTYMIDDKVYKETTYEYGAPITPEPQPEGDYATFEWIDLPQTMPAHDVVVYASYTSGIVELQVTRRQNVRIYSPNGKRLNTFQKGVNIIRMNDGKTKKIVVK